MSQANVKVRGYRPGGEIAVVALWKLCLPTDTISSGVPRERVLVASRGAKIAGFCLYGGHDGVAERVGPFGVDRNLQEIGLGTVPLFPCLEQICSQGLNNAWCAYRRKQNERGVPPEQDC